jgi:hypothetical protein
MKMFWNSEQKTDVLAACIAEVFLARPTPEAVATAIVRDYKQEGWGAPASARDSLGMLRKYQQSRIPFANLYLQYSRHPVSTLDQGLVYEYLLNSGGIAREGERAIGGVLGREGLGWKKAELREGRHFVQ